MKRSDVQLRCSERRFESAELLTQSLVLGGRFVALLGAPNELCPQHGHRLGEGRSRIM
ncbi:MAG: hypothetical protein ACXVHX_09450 [Solirubrobacteraceae bacterium]